MNHERPPTLKDVAELAGVDVSLVSKLINDDPNLRISEPTRRRVEEAIRATDYRPNHIARALRTSRGRTIAFLQQGFTNPIYARIATGAVRAAHEHDYLFVIGDIDEVVEAAAGPGRLVRYRQGGVDGLLVGASILADDVIARLLREPMPMVMVNRRVAGTTAWVAVDDTAAVDLAVDTLRGARHVRVGLLSGPADYESTQRRRTAFNAAMPGGGPVGFADSLSAHDGYRAGLLMLDRHPGLTAILAGHVMLGVGLLRAAAERGVAVPRELSVIGLHDSEIANYVTPRLTTVDTPMEELGAAAVTALIAVIEGRPPVPSLVVSAPKLVSRASVASPAGNVIDTSDGYGIP
ncbi:MAG TPA: LacI family DNA-binding transcriptional regulator [Pseudonocardiaceae bacterium]|nr:LacI family DNA-binding transcriptional regulator [Pseudonocardiaceae bacterium]